MRDLRPLLGGETLERVAELTTMRQRTELRDRHGTRLAEIDDDWVSASVPVAVRFREVEIELDAGDAGLLDGLARWLRSAGAEPLAGGPKLARVLAARLTTAPARRPGLGRRSSVADVVAASLAQGLDRLVDGDLGIRFGDDPESVHQARVATRRLRSDLKTFGAALDPGWVRRTRAELGWVAGLLGQVRDTDVLAGRLTSVAAASADIDAVAINGLQDTLAAQRAEVYEQLREALGSGRYVELVRSLEDAVGSPPFASGASLVAPARTALRPLLRRPWRTLCRTAGQLGSEPSDHDLHLVRIKAKQLRYAAELAAPVAGERAARLGHAAQALQDVLGDHRDAVVAEQWLRQVAAAGDAASAFAAGQCVTLERQRQTARRDEWPEVWRKLRRKKLPDWLRT